MAFECSTISIRVAARRSSVHPNGFVWLLERQQRLPQELALRVRRQQRRQCRSAATTSGPFANVSLQPLRQLQASLSGRYEHAIDDAQWIENRDADGDGRDDNVYGTLHQDVLDLTLRGTYAFSPDFTIQAYLQPFVAVGDYQNIRRLARPRSYEFMPVAIPSNPDFNRKSVHGNVVLRWEYLRGSTLFVVWNLSQSDSTRPGQFGALRDVGSAFGAERQSRVPGQARLTGSTGSPGRTAELAGYSSAYRVDAYAGGALPNVRTAIVVVDAVEYHCRRAA